MLSCERVRLLLNLVGYAWGSLLLCPTVCAPAISPGLIWWQRVLKIQVSCSQWEGSACRSRFSLWGEEGLGGIFWLFSCSHPVPKGFSKIPQIVPPKTFPITPMFPLNPFNQSPISSPISSVNWAIFTMLEGWGEGLKMFSLSFTSRGTMCEDSTSFEFLSVRSLAYLPYALETI